MAISTQDGDRSSTTNYFQVERLSLTVWELCKAAAKLISIQCSTPAGPDN